MKLHRTDQIDSHQNGGGTGRGTCLNYSFSIPFIICSFKFVRMFFGQRFRRGRIPMALHGGLPSWLSGTPSWLRGPFNWLQGPPKWPEALPASSESHPTSSKALPLSKALRSPSEALPAPSMLRSSQLIRIFQPPLCCLCETLLRPPLLNLHQI